jgi:hypothetical protein
MPATAFDGKNFLCVWYDAHYGVVDSANINGTFVTESGDTSPSFTICGAEHEQACPCIAFGDGNYFVAWLDWRNTPTVSVYGARVAPDGTVLDPNGWKVADLYNSLQLSGGNNELDVAYDSTSQTFLVVWHDVVGQTDQVFCEEVNPGYWNGAEVQLSDPQVASSSPCVCPACCGPTRYLVCWQESQAQSCFPVYGALVDSNGQTEVPRFLIVSHVQSNKACTTPEAAFDGRNCLVVWDVVPVLEQASWSIEGRLVSPTGTLVGGTVPILNSPGDDEGGRYPVVAFDGITYLVTWQDGRLYPGSGYWQIYARRVSTQGTMISSDFLVNAQQEDWEHVQPMLALGSHEFLIVYADWRRAQGVPPEPSDVYGALVDPCMIPSNATAGNSGRHISRAANSTVRNWVFSTNVGIFAQNSSDAYPRPCTFVGEGSECSIAQNESNLVWVVAVDTTDRALECYFRRADGTWRTKTVYSIEGGEQIDQPSLHLSLVVNPNNVVGDVGYCVFKDHVSGSVTPTYGIRFIAFDSLGPYDNEWIDDQSTDPPFADPCIAITPGDFIHVVWRKGPDIFYKTTTNMVHPYEQPQWDTYPEPLAHGGQFSLRHTFVEADVESVFVVWRGPNANQQDIGEIWRLDGAINPGNNPNWNSPPWIPYPTPSIESDLPTMSTERALVWQEDVGGGGSSNTEVYGLVDDNQFYNLSETSTPSLGPHCDFIAPPLALPFDLAAAWTEGSAAPPPDYYMRYFDVGPLNLANRMPPSVFALTLGESVPSRYCLKRDGYDRSGRLPVDVAKTQLTYRLPYLHPRKYYLLEGVVYQEADSQRQASMSFGGQSWTLTARRSRPETLMAVIPPGTYDSTCVGLTVDRLTGSGVSLASLKLYEFEFYEPGRLGSGIPDKLAAASMFGLKLAPSPFSTSQYISYSVRKSGIVQAEVCDLTGRVVRQLQRRSQAAGSHQVVFDGRDGSGRELPSGVYIIRLQTPDGSASKVTILAR